MKVKCRDNCYLHNNKLFKKISQPFHPVLKNLTNIVTNNPENIIQVKIKKINFLKYFLINNLKKDKIYKGCESLHTSKRNHI